MSSSVGQRTFSKVVTATNAAMNVRVGFVPEKVKITNLTTPASAEWHELMADASAVLTVAAGTRTNESSDGVTPLAASGGNLPGFTLGALSDINDTTTEQLLIEAWGQ